MSPKRVVPLRFTAHARRRAAQMRLRHERVVAILDTATHSFPGRPTSHGTPTTMWCSRSHPGYLVCTTKSRCGATLVVTVLFDQRRRYRRCGAGYTLLPDRSRTSRPVLAPARAGTVAA